MANSAAIAAEKTRIIDALKEMTSASLRDLTRLSLPSLRVLHSLIGSAQKTACADSVSTPEEFPRSSTLELDALEREFLLHGHVISAIKSLRARTPGLGLKEAKEIVDAFRFAGRTTES